MESATLTPPRGEHGLTARLRAVDPRHWARVGFLVLCAGAAVGYLVYPTWPNYDSAYSLLWGREVLHGHLPSFDAYRAPTEHPLAVAVGAVLSPLGDAVAPRVWLALTVASFCALVAGVYRLGRVAFTPWVGLVAALLLMSRLEYAFLAARGYIDIPYLALVVWAGALECERPRRGGVVWLLLGSAGLLRPEAWVLLGVYWLWCAAKPRAERSFRGGDSPGGSSPRWSAGRRVRVAKPRAERSFRGGDSPGGSSPRWSAGRRVRVAAYAAVAPVLWALTDLAATGDPAFSLRHTSSLAADLQRSKPASQAPSVLVHGLDRILKWPVLLGALLGLALAWTFARRRTPIPLVMTASGVVTFGLIAAAGLSVIDRYLAITAVGLLVFAGFAIAGFTVLPAGSAVRRPWLVLAGTVAAGGALFTLTHLHPGYIDRELSTRRQLRTELTHLLHGRAFAAARRCGPVTVPNHKLIPDTRWILDAGADQVLARSALPGYGRQTKGVAIFVSGPRMMTNTTYGPFDPAVHDDPLIQVPGPGAVLIDRSNDFAVYASC